jgi:hypothetical protein
LPATGASGPSYIFAEILQRPTINVPYANADENNHAPNENMQVDLFYKGIETTCHVLIGLAQE